MPFYLDTSVVVALLFAEPGHEAALAWLESAARRRILVSRWTSTEFSSAVALKQRTGQVTAPQAAVSRSLFDELCARRFDVVDVEQPDFALTGRLCADYASALRAGDALHLAIAARCGATMVALDTTLVSACERHGVTAVAPT
jgi:hypothetical protein